MLEVEWDDGFVYGEGHGEKCWNEILKYSIGIVTVCYFCIDFEVTQG